MKNPVEAQPPAGDHFFIVLRVEVSRDHIPFALLDDVPPDLCHGPAIEGLVNEPSEIFTTGSTHRVNRSIASNTG